MKEVAESGGQSHPEDEGRRAVLAVLADEPAAEEDRVVLGD